MERRKFTREFKLEGRDPRTRSDGGASRARFGHTWHGVAPLGPGGCCRFVAGLSGPGADELEQAELARLLREVIKLRAERDIF